MFLPFPIRQMSPCQTFTVADLQQSIAAGAAQLIAPLRAIPGIAAAVRGVTVTCPGDTVQIPILINYRAGGISARGLVRIFATINPVSIAAARPICVTIRGRFFDLVSLPTEVQQQIENVISRTFSRTICLSPPPVLGQAR